MRKWFIFLFVLAVTFVLGVHINLQAITQIIQKAFECKFHINIEEVGVYYHTGLKAAIVNIRLSQPIDDATALSTLLADLKPKIEEQGIDEGEVVGWTIKVGAEEWVFGKSVWEIKLAEEFLEKEEKQLSGTIPYSFPETTTVPQKRSTSSSPRVYSKQPSTRVYTKQYRSQSPIWLTPQQIEATIETIRKAAISQKLNQPISLPYQVRLTTPNDIIQERGTPNNILVDKGCLYYLYITPDGLKGEIFVFDNQKLVLMTEIVSPLTDNYLGHLLYIHASNFEYLYGFPQMYVATTVLGKTDIMVPAEIAYKTQKHMIANFIVGWFDKTLTGIVLLGGKTPARFFMILRGDIEWFLRNYITFFNNLQKLGQSLL